MSDRDLKSAPRSQTHLYSASLIFFTLTLLLVWLERQGSIPYLSQSLGLPWLDLGVESGWQKLWNSGVLLVFIMMQLVARNRSSGNPLHPKISTMALLIFAPLLPLFFWFPTMHPLWVLSLFDRPDLNLAVSVLLFWLPILYCLLKTTKMSHAQMTGLFLLCGVLTPFLSFDRLIWVLAMTPFFSAIISLLRMRIFQLE
ncbi:MAG: hypothetical protein EOP04_12830 [Proteobacteria bacterium]|nr:MAG: hypothetical protein EOP04_12830 [Pseudomonadota bacterium]